MAQAATLSSAGTATIVLNPLAKTTTVMLSATLGASNSTVQVEMTLDDPSLAGGPSVVWGTLSSGTAMLSSQVTNLVYTVLAPIGGVRINSTLNSSLTTYTLRALQSPTA